MDYVYCASLRHFSEVEIMTMYDIVCQWALHLEERMADMPEDLWIEVAKFRELRYAIGKLHWHGHKKEGHSRFSLNYLFGSNRTDGEGVERRWWDIQPIANSTKMMGPGGREATLNDVWGFANWLKTIGLRTFMPATDIDHLLTKSYSFRPLQEIHQCCTRSRRTTRGVRRLLEVVQP